MHEIIRHPFSFQGRITRKTFWLANILLIIVSYVIAVLITLSLTLLQESPSNKGMEAVSIITEIITLLLFIGLWIGSLFIYASLVVKRAHDTGSAGWLWLFGSVLLFIPWIILGFLPGEDTSNTFGSTRY